MTQLKKRSNFVGRCFPILAGSRFTSFYLLPARIRHDKSDLSYPHSFHSSPSFLSLVSIKLKYLKLLIYGTIDIEIKLLLTKEPDEFIEL